ncbi:MAG TPA: FxDxF family PEP-CTERM protein [Sphingobium sp.]|nr:FxDxF family PEP-CTERM protein [Sphingobium sp.]
MKKFLLATSAALAAFAMAPSASGATFYEPTDPNGITLTLDNLSDGFSSQTLPIGEIHDIFNFTVPVDGMASVLSVVTSVPGARLADFAGGLYSGDDLLSSFTFEMLDGGVLFGSLAPILLTGGVDYRLVFTGEALERTSYGGNLTVTPVPEPATWAMMIAGIAAVGLTMRRSQTTRIAFS